MRRVLTLSAALLVAGCATAPQPPPAPQPVQPQPTQQRGDLIGLTAGELVQRFGTPALQVREGVGIKLQFRSRLCVLDAFLYPPGSRGGTERVTYVETRLPSGATTEPGGCIASLQRA